MSYKNATHILPKDLLRRVQQYVDGEFLYIPRAAGSKKAWGESTSIRQELLERNRRISKHKGDSFMRGCCENPPFSLWK